MEFKSKEEKALFDCYARLYKEATPSADFNELVENAWVNERNQKVIPFDDYRISEKRMLEIIDETFKEHKLKKHLYERFVNTVYLGCSPKFF